MLYFSMIYLYFYLILNLYIHSKLSIDMFLNFDYDKCTSCGLCRKACGSKLIEFDDENKPKQVYPIVCNDCGHCVSVCPVGAVENVRMDINDFKDMVNPNISYEDYVNLVRNRHSIRNFRKEPLKKEHINKLLHSVRYIPTGSNQQGLRYIFITDPEILDEIKKAMAKKFKLTSNLSNLFFVRPFVAKEERASLKRQVDLWEEGFDIFLRNAPCLLVIHTDYNYYGITAWDAAIATYNIDLAAQTLGIGTLMNGFHTTTCKIFKSVKKISKVPKKHKILASMCLGYPDIEYKRTIYRNPLDSEII
ncbi:MAG: 4Fe-4S dicluster domain-containing protein [Candidatus Lokiarchaeota archaeon]|nr:4Fe-4S dicluster domain-containing protein [Candidatus Lokiarchaeota archaeon]